MSKFIRTHKELLELMGAPVTCYIDDHYVDDAKISVEPDGQVFICQDIFNGAFAENRLGYQYSWLISENATPYEKENQSCTRIELKESMDSIVSSFMSTSFSNTGTVSVKIKPMTVVPLAGSYIYVVSANAEGKRSYYLRKVEGEMSASICINPVGWLYENELNDVIKI